MQSSAHGILVWRPEGLLQFDVDVPGTWYDHDSIVMKLCARQRYVPVDVVLAESSYVYGGVYQD